MIDQDKTQADSLANEPITETQIALPSGKKKFVDPEISQPVDVLEATTFFQSADSGPTN